MTALDKLIETLFTLEHNDRDNRFCGLCVSLFAFLEDHKCCLFCEKWHQCESCNKSEDSRCASFERSKEIRENGVRSFLEKRMELVKKLNL